MSRFRSYRLAALLATFGILTACSAGEPTSPPGSEALFTFQFTEAAGDTINPSETSTGRATDLVGISGQLESDYVVLTLQFSQSIQPWSSGAATALDGFVDFDMDENSATGIPGAVDEYGGSSGVGAEAYLSLRDNGLGQLAVVNVMGQTFSTVAVTFAGTTMTARIPRAYLTKPNSERFRVSAVLGNRDRPATDFGPDEGYFLVAR